MVYPHRVIKNSQKFLQINVQLKQVSNVQLLCTIIMFFFSADFIKKNNFTAVFSLLYDIKKWGVMSN